MWAYASLSQDRVIAITFLRPRIGYPSQKEYNSAFQTWKLSRTVVPSSSAMSFFVFHRTTSSVLSIMAGRHSARVKPGIAWPLMASVTSTSTRPRQESRPGAPERLAHADRTRLLRLIGRSGLDTHLGRANGIGAVSRAAQLAAALDQAGRRARRVDPGTG